MMSGRRRIERKKNIVQVFERARERDEDSKSSKRGLVRKRREKIKKNQEIIKLVLREGNNKRRIGTYRQRESKIKFC